MLEHKFRSPYLGDDDLDALVHPEPRRKEEPWEKEWRLAREKEEAQEIQAAAEREKKSRAFTISTGQATGGSEEDENG